MHLTCNATVLQVFQPTKKRAKIIKSKLWISQAFLVNTFGEENVSTCRCPLDKSSRGVRVAAVAFLVDNFRR